MSTSNITCMFSANLLSSPPNPPKTSNFLSAENIFCPDRRSFDWGEGHTESQRWLEFKTQEFLVLYKPLFFFFFTVIPFGKALIATLKILSCTFWRTLENHTLYDFLTYVFLYLSSKLSSLSGIFKSMLEVFDSISPGILFIPSFPTFPLFIMEYNYCGNDCDLGNRKHFYLPLARN